MFTYFFRGISVMLAVLYTAASVFIGNFPNEEAQAETAILPVYELDKTPAHTTVKILQGNGEISFLLQQAIDLYSERMLDNISFSVQTVAVESDYHSALRASLLSNDGADLFQISGAREYLELARYIRPLDSGGWAASAYQGTLDAVSQNDRIYGIPYSIEAVGLICNRAAFESAEISPESIRTLEDLDEAFAKIKEQIMLGESELLIGMEDVTQLAAGDKAFLDAKLADIALGGAFSSAQEAAASVDVSVPAAEQAEEFVKIMAKYSGSHPNWTRLAEITDAQQIEAFANGRVAVILQDTEVLRRINDINPDMRGHALLLPIPMDIFEQPAIYAGAPSYWAVNAAASDAAATAATGFLEWLYTSDEGSELFADGFGAVSAFRGTAKSTGVALHSQLLSYLAADMARPRFYREYPAGWGKNVFAPNVQGYFTERAKTWDEVVEACRLGWAA